MKKPKLSAKSKPNGKPSPNGKATIEMFKELKRAQIEDVKVLLKAVPNLLAAQTQEMTPRERQNLEEKIRQCKDRIRFCYFLYTDAVALLGPKPRWLIAE
jgi:hypothetical protein